MKINWVIARDNKKALLNNGDLEVIIKEIDLTKEKPTQQKISNRFKSSCGFIKTDSNRVYECIIVQNNMEYVLDELDMETASKLIPNLFSSLGDIYEER